MIAQQIVEKFDGSISFNSEYGQGSCFQFAFKLIEKDSDRALSFISDSENKSP